MDEAEKIVKQTLRKSLERREVKLGARSVADIAGVIVDSLREAGLLVVPMDLADMNEMDAKHPGWDQQGKPGDHDVIEPTEEEVGRAARALEKAGFAWIHERDPKMISTGWADVPEEVFARAALVAFLNPDAPSDDAKKGMKA